MPSFDIVSKYDMQEIDNAVNIVKRDIARNDWKIQGTAGLRHTFNRSYKLAHYLGFFWVTKV